MKTLEEVKKHIHEVGYTDTAQLRIAGFLVGVGVKDEHEIIVFRNGVNEFSTFLHWFNDSPSDYFRRKDVFEDEFKNEKPKLKAKAYQDSKWFDITFDEICKNLKKYNPVICDGVVPDEILAKIFDELGIGNNESKNNSNKSKERELSIIDSMGLDKINPIALSTESLKAVNELLKRRNELEKQLNETVD